MARHTGKHGVRRSWCGSVAVMLVVALTGYLMFTNFRVNRTATVSSDAADLIEARTERVAELQEEIYELSSEIDTLNKVVTDSDDTDSDDSSSSTMLPEVWGEGVIVTLDDSPLWESMVDDSGSTSNINDYVVHQQDVEAVVNALWAGGAEAMMIQDQRVLSSSAVICSGNVLMLQGRQYSPPYTISAIGPIDEMLEALEESTAVSIYMEYVSAFGLGWNVETSDELHFEESAMLLQSLSYASVLNDDDTEETTDDTTDDTEDSEGTAEDTTAEEDETDEKVNEE